MNALKKLVALLLLAVISTSAFAITNAQVFAYAEANYSALFSGTPSIGQTTYQGNLYSYQYYPTSRNYLAVDSTGIIYMLGTATGGALATIGPVSVVTPAITAWQATQTVAVSTVGVATVGTTSFDGTYRSTVTLADGFTHTETDTISGNAVSSSHTFTNGTASGSFTWTGTITRSATNPSSGTIAGSGTINNMGIRPFTLQSGSVTLNTNGSADLNWTATDTLFGPIGWTTHRP